MSCSAAVLPAAGTEVLCFHVPGPMPLQAQTDEYPSLAQHLQQARQKENSELWVDATASYGWDLPMLVANGLVDSIEVANSHFGRKAMQPDEKLGKPRDADRYARPLRLRPLVAGRLLQAAGLRPADSAHGRQRFRRFAQSGGLQSRLRTPGQQLRLSAVVEEPEGRAGRRQQRPAVASAGRERVAGPHLPRRGGPRVGTANRHDADHPRADQLPGDRAGRPGAEYDSFRGLRQGRAGCRRCTSSTAAGSSCGRWPRFPTRTALP